NGSINISCCRLYDDLKKGIAEVKTTATNIYTAVTAAPAYIAGICDKAKRLWTVIDQCVYPMHKDCDKTITDYGDEVHKNPKLLSIELGWWTDCGTARCAPVQDGAALRSFAEASKSFLCKKMGTDATENLIFAKVACSVFEDQVKQAKSDRYV